MSESRQIKLRAWRAENIGGPRMMDWADICTLYLPYGEILPQDENDGWTLMQYIGQRDINDVEVYEGDVVLLRSTDDLPYDEIKAVIRYVAGGGFFSPVLVFSDEYSCEVVGNVYENPELLEWLNE